MKEQTHPCLILCAGTSKRFGADKILAPLGGKPVLSHVIERMRPQVSNMALNAGNSEEYDAFGLPVLADIIPGGLGPLAGVLTAMEWGASLGRSRVLTVSGDTPFLPNDLLTRCAAAPKDHIVTPFIEGRTQRVCSLWPVGIAPQLRDFLQANNSLRVKDFMVTQKRSEIDFTLQNGWNPFFNINTQDDLAKAEGMFTRQ